MPRECVYFLNVCFKLFCNDYVHYIINMSKKWKDNLKVSKGSVDLDTWGGWVCGWGKGGWSCPQAPMICL